MTEETGSSHQEAPIDIVALRQVIRHRVDLEKKLLFMLYEAAQEDILTLSLNIYEETPGAWEYTAHGLKGASANVCVDRMVILCEEAEDIPAGETEKRQAFLQAIREEFTRIESYLLTLHPQFLEEYKTYKAG